MDDQLKWALEEIRRGTNVHHDILSAQLQKYGALNQNDMDIINGEKTGTQKLTNIFLQLNEKQEDVIETLQKICCDNKWFPLLNKIQAKLREINRAELIFNSPYSNRTHISNVADQANQAKKEIKVASVTSVEPIQSLVSVQPKHGHENLSINLLHKPPVIYPYNPNKPRGEVLIINNKYFPNRAPDHREREGSGKDVRKMQELFGMDKLGYRVDTKKNLTASEIKKQVKKFADKVEHNASDSAVVMIFTHGGENVLCGTDDIAVPIKEVFECLNADNCKALQDKPKIFIIQACRGEKIDTGNYTTADCSISDDTKAKGFWDSADSFDENDKPFKKIPLGADFLIAYSTSEEFVSHRNRRDGSWFIQDIYNVFDQKADYMEIKDMFVEVNSAVSNRESVHPNNPIERGNVQMPHFGTSFRKQFYFFPDKIGSAKQ